MNKINPFINSTQFLNVFDKLKYWFKSIFNVFEL